MLQVPTTEAKEQSEATRAARKPEPHRELRPHAHTGAAPRAISPGAASPGPRFTAMQRAMGNQAMLRMLNTSKPVIQTKLTVNQPGDSFEQEADRVADHVMSMAGAPVVQRSCSSCKDEDKDKLQRKCAACDEEEKELHRKESDSGPVLAPASVNDVLNSPGQPLDSATRAFMEPRFGQDFSAVRVHADERAAESARAIRALAYTNRNSIVFDTAQYNPQSTAGRRLLAHELTHVVQQGRVGHSRLSRQPKAEVTLGEPQINPPESEQKEEWARLQVFAAGMDDAALVLAGGIPVKRNKVFIGLHPKFVKVYDQTGKPLGAKINLKEVKGLVFNPGVYIQGPQGGLIALTVSGDDKTIGAESGNSVIGHRPYTDEEKASMAEEGQKAEAEGREAKPSPAPVLNFVDQLDEPDRFRSMVASVPDALAIYFVPTYTGTNPKPLYASPIEGRGDGQPPNAPPWPVTVDGLTLVPTDSDPTYSAKVDWTANGNSSLVSQVISQVGETIHYRWELFDITQYAKKELSKDPAATKDQAASKPDKSLKERVEDFEKSKAGTGTDVTGMGGANREFSREFGDWWKDTKRAGKGSVNPNGDTVGERLSNAEANRLSLELAPVTLLTTAVGAALRWVADLFAGPRQQQEIPLKSEGVFLVRVITTPAIGEDTKGNPVVRPPSVAARVTEVTPIDHAVEQALDEPGKQIDELSVQIAAADLAGNKSKADYLRSLKTEATERYEGSALTLLVKKRDQKQQDLEKFRKAYPSLSDYSRAREVEMLNDQIALYKHHEEERTAGTTGPSSLKRVNATLISEVTGEQYPLLLSAGPMAMVGSQYQWMISDVTNRDGDAFTGLGDTPSAALLSALKKFGAKAAYGRGRIGLTTSGLDLEAKAESKFIVDSEPADWALAEKRIDDLVSTLALLGLVVASAGTAGALIGAAAAAARLIQRWQAGRLYLDAQTVSDVFGVLGGLGVAGQLAGGLRMQKLGKAFVILQEGRATESELAAAEKALEGAQKLASAVETANEAINYGGLIWGNVSFVDQMMSISDQERSGAMTHAAARRARATAISSAVQNNGLFLAGNVMKAKHAAPKEKAGTPTATATHPGEVTPGKSETGEAVPESKGTKGETTQGKADDQATTAHQPEPLPIGERQATPAELKAALPVDLQDMLFIDQSLKSDTVMAEYWLDPWNGLISDIRLRCGPDARPASVKLHIETIRTMQKYQGFSGRIRQAISWVGDLIGIETLNPEKNPISFEAALEIRKLPTLINAQMERMRAMEPNAHDMAEAELDHLKLQLDQNLRTLGLGEIGQGEGFVAAKGLSKAKQKQYADLLVELRRLEPNTEPHKEKRWEMYQLIGGDLPRPTWEKIYASNVEKANKANASVKAEHARLGWGEPEQTVKVGKDEIRRLDIADKKAQKGVEVKEYGTHYITASEDIVWEVQRDAKLVKAGWDITWVLVDTDPSGPLLEMLQGARIKVELRTRKGGGESTLVDQFLPLAHRR